MDSVERRPGTRGPESLPELRALFDAMPQLGWFARPDGYIVFYNRGWYAYTGTTPEEMEGWGWRSVHDQELLPSVEARWRHSIATGTSFELTFPLRRHDGVFRWFLTRVDPMRDEEGRITGWVGINTDVDDQRRSEERVATALEGEQRARQRSEELAAENARLLAEAREQMQAHVELNRALRDALDAGAREASERARAERELERQREDLHATLMQAPVAICVVAGEELVFELANPAYSEIVGGRELVGRRLVDAFAETDVTGFAELLRGVMRTGDPVVMSEALVPLERDGVLSDRYFTFIYAPLRNADGVTDRVIAVVSEVTEQVQSRQRTEALAAELAKEKKRLEAALTQIRRLG